MTTLFSIKSRQESETKWTVVGCKIWVCASGRDEEWGCVWVSQSAWRMYWTFRCRHRNTVSALRCTACFQRDADIQEVVRSSMEMVRWREAWSASACMCCCSLCPCQILTEACVSFCTVSCSSKGCKIQCVFCAWECEGIQDVTCWTGASGWRL